MYVTPAVRTVQKEQGGCIDDRHTVSVFGNRLRTSCNCFVSMKLVKE
jgi:hypothetical protein